ncbi:hypothetical protein HYFRA_00007809 [Hymenoscyphus fraxineus]|uniref:Uncharacterized protein n=1 Tax=Hymenoscyphus fraxineus TaxID=746836 RepID=A0A9N9KM95_9HELO|nr:hypothetical protein HYFRA_00007809 [Hymenoscyphus fraxineus]
MNEERVWANAMIQKMVGLVIQVSNPGGGYGEGDGDGDGECDHTIHEELEERMKMAEGRQEQ